MAKALASFGDGGDGLAAWRSIFSAREEQGVGRELRTDSSGGQGRRCGLPLESVDP
jgi:hypothetical protein